MSKMDTVAEFESPDEVKVVVDKKAMQSIFLEPIPSRKKGVEDVPMLKQVCIILSNVTFLSFNQLSETELEVIESVDMMRIIENGIKFIW